MLSVSLQKRQGQTHTLIHSTHIFTRDSSLNSSCGQFNYVCPLKARSRPHLRLRRGVDDVIDGRRGAENRHVSSFELLDPVAELGPVQTGHHYGVDHLAWEERRGGQSLSFGPLAHWNVL